MGKYLTLGNRIDTARRQYDPVALGNTASELALAEKVSGKQASLTSTALYKESVELAKLRRQVAELDYLTGSRAAMTSLAENYVGLPWE